ncbi:hypothetical protein [Empedobacter tilapiae]|uniref:Uncharacterized protein n=1 Tax=Empedobacter tilapiae TaxID=2491114 RepID=A0A4Z1B0L4_9FLAO|nr:hypothetical protein [Empedobacter tilapiae]TGN23718.1 hypothetical protein E4J94_14805 [Empedobacter tilapiae]
MDKYSFEIFVPEKPKKNNKQIAKVILSFLAVTVISFVFLELNVFKNQTYYYIFIGLLATAVAYWNGYFKKPSTELKGNFDGKLTFSNEGISVKNQFYPINELYSIIIDNKDYKGKSVKEFGEFDNPNGSHGISNLITLKTKDNQFVEVYFLQKSLSEFSKIESFLIQYYKSNLLSEDDLISIMHLEYDIDKNELRKKLR